MDDLAVKKLFSDLLGSHSSIYELEKEMLEWPGAITAKEDPVEHIFSGGVYIRQVVRSKGHISIGKRHRYETCNMLLKGQVSIYSDENMPIKKVIAPFLFTSKPMTKKLLYYHEDSIFCNIHPTKETDLEKIENEFIIPEEEYLKLPEGEIK